MTFYLVRCFTRFNEGSQIQDFMSSSGSGTVINYGSGSDFLTSYGSGSTSQKVTVPTVPVPQHCLWLLNPDSQHWKKHKLETGMINYGETWQRSSPSSTRGPRTEMSRLWIEPRPPRWEASTLEKSHSNSLEHLRPRQNIFYIHITGTGIYVKNTYFCITKLRTGWLKFTGISQFGGMNANRCNERFATVPCPFAEEVQEFRQVNQGCSFVFPPHDRGDDAAAETSDGRRRPAWTSRRRWWQRACRCPWIGTTIDDYLRHDQLLY